ncbi:MAG: hypothetical protein IKS32_10650 [Solobacterium sp.]|nr:hypothetical protein [Solobacterium sp.]
MEELDQICQNSSGIAALSPEQTVTLLRCFMNDEEMWTTARLAGITITQAEQCTMDLWNVFSHRRRELANV